MQIARLSMGPRMTGLQQSCVATNGSGFAGILSKQIVKYNQLPREGIAKDDGSLSDEEIKKLLRLLRLEDRTALTKSLAFENITESAETLQQENSTQAESMFHEMLTSTEARDVTTIITHYLQLSEEEILSSLLSLLAGIQVNEAVPQGNPMGLNENGFLALDNEIPIPSIGGEQLRSDGVVVNGVLQQEKKEMLLQNLAQFRESVSQGNVVDSFQTLMDLLRQLDMKHAVININKEAIPAIKSLKLFQHIQNGDGAALQSLLEKVADSLEALRRKENALKRNEWLQQTFAPIVKEAKQGRVPLLPVYPVLDRAMKRSANMDGKAFSVQQGNTGLHTDNNALFPIQPLPKSEPFVLLLEKSGKPVTSEQLLTQFERILANSQLVKTGLTKRMFIKLHPEHLGTIKVELLQQHSGMTAKITAATNAAKELLESQLQQLRRAFTQQNMSLEKIEITVGSNEEQERIFHREREQEQQRQQHEEQQKQKHEEKKDPALSFAEALISAEI